MAIDEQALARSLRELTGSATGGAMHTLSHQLGVVVGAAAELLGVDCVGVLLLDEADRVRTVAVTGRAAAALESAQERLQIGPGVDVQGFRQVVSVPDLAEHPRYRALWHEVADSGVRGVMSVPVWVRQEVVGNLNAVTEQVHAWSDAERRAGEAYAALVGQLLIAATHAARRDSATHAVRRDSAAPETVAPDPGAGGSAR
jgi:GAF domain-containing protein